MKTLKLLTVCFVVSCLFTSHVFACTTALDDSLAPSGQPYAAGDTINYVATLELTDPEDCPIKDIVITFYPPNVASGVDPDNICDSPGGVVVYDGGPAVFSYGDPAIVIDGGVDTIMDYIVNPDDVIDAEAGPLSLKAYICTTFTAITDIGDLEGQDEKASINVLAINPDVQVTKEACEYSKVGDTITWDITIENTGTEALLLTSINDPLLGGDLTDEAVAANCDVLGIGGSCQFSVDYPVMPDDEPGPIVNEITVEYEATVDGVTGVGVFVSDSDTAEVILLHPSFTLDVECLEIVDSMAYFEVTFCNTGDVDLMVDPNDPDISPFALPVPVDSECSVFVVEVPLDQSVCGAGSATKTVSALASLIMPQDTSPGCELGNIIIPEPEEDSATCTAEVNPAFTADKVCLDTTPADVADGYADFQINFSNTGDVPLLFEIDDPAAGYNALVGPLAPGASDSVVVSVPAEVQGCPATVDVLNAATVTGICDIDGTRLDPLPIEATCPGICADFTVEKNCVEDIVSDANALFEIIVCNTGDVELSFEIDDPAAGIVDMLVGPIAAGACSDPILVEVPAECIDGEVSNTAIVQAIYDGEPILEPQEASAICECGGEEGCTPGYWKNSPGCWACYSPETLLNEVFDFSGAPARIADYKGTKTMMEALKFKGGSWKVHKLRIMLRHATAAVLNACNGDVEYPASVASIVEDVNYILTNFDTVSKSEIIDLKRQFEEWNELGCPISADNSANPCQRNIDED